MDQGQDQIKAQEEQMIARARSLAMQFDEVRGDRTWFKPVHIKRNVRHETIDTVTLKLNMLTELGFAKKKKNDHNDDWKYMITLSDEHQLAYLKEYREWLESEMNKTDLEIQRLK